MENFTTDFVRGTAVCPECGFSWQAVVAYGEFFTLPCKYCGGLVGELQEIEYLCGIA